MTPQQKIKHLILIKDAEWVDDAEETARRKSLTPPEIDAEYEALEKADRYWDPMEEIRSGEVETGLPCEWSRHYESKSVAAQYLDGSWVGWTYWYGGGKHGCPEEVEWIDGAKDLTCVEEEKVVTVRTFALADVPA